MRLLRLCIKLMHITPPVTAKRYDGSITRGTPYDGRGTDHTSTRVCRMTAKGQITRSPEYAEWRPRDRSRDHPMCAWWRFWVHFGINILYFLYTTTRRRLFRALQSGKMLGAQVMIEPNTTAPLPWEETKFNNAFIKKIKLYFVF